MLRLIYISQLSSFHLDLCSIFLYVVLNVIFQTYFFPLLGDLFSVFHPGFSLNVCPCFLISRLSFHPLQTFTLIYFPTHSFCKALLSVPKSASSILGVMQLAAIDIYYLLALMDSCICCSRVRCTAVDRRASDRGMNAQIKSQTAWTKNCHRFLFLLMQISAVYTKQFFCSLNQGLTDAWKNI